MALASRIETAVDWIANAWRILFLAALISSSDGANSRAAWTASASAARPIWDTRIERNGRPREDEVGSVGYAMHVGRRDPHARPNRQRVVAISVAHAAAVQS